jgi:hypothetical protein
MQGDFLIQTFRLFKTFIAASLNRLGRVLGMVGSPTSVCRVPRGGGCDSYVLDDAIQPMQ